MMLLLQDVDGLGSKFDMVDVPKDRVTELLAKRLAMHDTPLVRKRFEGLIREAVPSVTDQR